MKKDFWKQLVQIIIAILTAISSTLFVQSSIRYLHKPSQELLAWFSSLHGYKLISLNISYFDDSANSASFIGGMLVYGISN